MRIRLLLTLVALFAFPLSRLSAQTPDSAKSPLPPGPQIKMIRLLWPSLGSLPVGFGVRFPMSLPSNQLEIGRGYDSVFATIKSQTVKYDPNNPSQYLVTAAGSQNQETTKFLHEINSMSELRDTLELDASASFGWGIFSADASYNYYKTTTYSQYNRFLELRVSVLNAPEILHHTYLTESAISFAETGPSTFLRMCGDQYVYGRQTGGELDAIIQVSSSSQSQFDSQKTSVEGAVAAFGSGKLTFSQAIQQISTGNELTYFVHRNGGLGDIPSIDALTAYADSFPTIVQGSSGNAAIYALLTTDYTSLENEHPDKPFPLDTSIFDYVPALQQNLKSLAADLDKCYLVRGNLQFILTNLSQFKNPDQVRPKAEGLFQENEATIENIIAAAIDYKTNLKSTKPLPVVTVADFQPERIPDTGPTPAPATPPTPTSFPLNATVRTNEFNSGAPFGSPTTSNPENIYTVPPETHADVTFTGVGNPLGVQFVIQIGATAFINSGVTDQNILQTGIGAQFNKPVHLVAGESILVRVGYGPWAGGASPPLNPGAITITGTVDQGK